MVKIVKGVKLVENLEMDIVAGGFESLEVWKETRNFRRMMISICKLIPIEERFRLIDQIKRSSRSVTANIAEEYGRFHYLDNIKFCRDARGSLNETLDHLTAAYDEQYISEETLAQLKSQFEKSLKLLNGYIGYLKRMKQQ
jgi:four helix bundle protein